MLALYDMCWCLGARAMADAATKKGRTLRHALASSFYLRLTLGAKLLQHFSSQL
jgi:DNA mismatch repair protein MutH